MHLPGAGAIRKCRSDCVSILPFGVMEVQDYFKECTEDDSHDNGMAHIGDRSCTKNCLFRVNHFHNKRQS